MTTKTTIAKKNDILRYTLAGCSVVLTAGVAHSPDRDAVIKAVRCFNDFCESNDPYGEHDFGFVEVNGKRYFFKFDYYDASGQYFEEDGCRVLTIGLASEY